MSIVTKSKQATYPIETRTITYYIIATKIATISLVFPGISKLDDRRRLREHTQKCIVFFCDLSKASESLTSSHLHWFLHPNKSPLQWPPQVY